MKYYLTIEMDEILLFTKWMELKNIMLQEISQAREEK